MAVAAALTSTSLRERCREPGDEAAAGVLEEGTALAAGRQVTCHLYLQTGRGDSEKVRTPYICCCCCCLQRRSFQTQDDCDRTNTNVS